MIYRLASGYKAILLSVDTPLLGRRLNEYRNNFVLPDDMAWPNLLSNGKDELSGRYGQTEDTGVSRYDFGERKAQFSPRGFMGY